MARGKKLTPDEERFVDEYLIDRNGTAAYVRAFPGTKRASAGKMAARMKAKAAVKAAIADGLSELRRACRTSAANEVKGLALLANYDVGGAFDLSKDDWVLLPPRQIPIETRLAIVGIKFKRRRETGPGGVTRATVEDVEYKFADKLAARDKLMRHLGLYKDLPPLEVLLAALPTDVAQAVRAALAAAVLAGRDRGGGGAANGGRADPPPGGLRPPDADGRPGPGPVAGGVDPLPGPAGGGPLHPPVGEDADGRLQDPRPLFDPAE